MDGQPPRVALQLTPTLPLDLANVSEFFDPPLRSVLCTPVTDNDHLVGVLTAYSNKSQAFSETHTYAFGADRLLVGR